MNAVRRPPSAAFRPRGVTPNRGNNVASPWRRKPAPCCAKKWAGSVPFRADASNRSPKCGRVFRNAKIVNCVSNRQSRKGNPSPAAIRDPRAASTGDCQKGRAARIHKHSNRPVFRKRLCQTNLLQALPAGASRVASVRRRVTHQVEGGSQPKGPGSNPSRRYVLITPWGQRPLKYGFPDVIEVSSTGT